MLNVYACMRVCVGVTQKKVMRKRDTKKDGETERDINTMKREQVKVKRKEVSVCDRGIKR